MTRILVVEDDADVAAGMASLLAAEGYVVSIAPDAATADRLLEERPALVLLDWRLPDEPGVDALRRWRARGLAIPVLLVTARSELIDRVLGLELGADDYITKPFAPRELLARVRARLRSFAPVRTVTAGRVTLDLDARSALLDGRTVALTRKEFDLLHALAEQPGRVWTRDELLERVWDYSRYTTRTVDTHVLQLRKKLEPALIETVRGVGYRLTET